MSSATKKGSILIIDDEPDILVVLEEFLSKEWFKVLTAKSGKDAIAKLSLNEIDLVLLDMAMPDMNGIEILKELKKIKPNIAVIMITAYRDAEKVVEAFRLGACDCIFKPFDLKYLRQAVMSKLLE
jgi:DNA-binding NtrC family response regulator